MRGFFFVFMETVAIQGIRGSFHEEAAARFFKQGFEPVECMDFRSLVKGVESGRAQWGVMAVENSLAGGMLPNFSLIRNSAMQIVGEIYLRITQNLMALPGETLSDLREVRSHPMALMQSEDFFLQHPAIRLVESYDTALSAQEIASHQIRGVGAVGSERAAQIYGLPILATSIETNKENFTRFLVIGPQPANLRKNVPVKASLAFIAPHVPGSLASVLTPLAEAGVNLSMLQSLPLVGKTWEYIFHADMLFKNSDHAHSTIETLKSMLKNLWVMGLYPPGEKQQLNDNKSTENKTNLTYVHTSGQ
jgi:prephenate dehydratase